MTTDNALKNSTYILFERVNPERNEERFYYLGWQPTLLDAGAVIRIYGRKGGQQRTLVTPCPTLEDAAPLVRRVIRRRLRNGYRIAKRGEQR